jgi:hypothetical protein
MNIILICISFMVRDVEHFFTYLWPFVLLWRIVCSVYFLIYWLDCLFFCCLIFGAFYTYWILILYLMKNWQRSSPILWLSFFNM